ncbi:MAG TPA: aldo/keto reductase [Polyangiaceae bacterium]|jgi:diketogulonate reductase-like aldo/keto reductase|nr:aldo/keto reductase [Polyangiaceae bacterium]
MKQRVLGPGGVQVAVIGEGTWNMERDDRASSIAAIRRALDLGATHIDTAEMYGQGNVERLVGEALSGRRAEAFLVSKVLPSNATRPGTLAACERSLKRLGTDYLDCYLLHWPGSHPLEETFRAFEDLRQAGKIRSWGVSNFDESELRRAVRIVGKGVITQNQVLYHLGERRIEHEVIPYCATEGIAVVAYSPFGSGDFPTTRVTGGKVLATIADAHGVTPFQIALAFLTRQTHVFAIPKASTSAHVEDNVRAADVSLTEADVAAIDEAFPRGPRRRGVPMF